MLEDTTSTPGALPHGDVARETPTPICAPATGYVRELRIGRLVVALRTSESAVRWHVRPGAFVRVGDVVGAATGESAAGAASRALVLGRSRTIEQDPRLGIDQLVEVALRALSPAVNDPFTARGCVDWLGDALVALADPTTRPGAFADRTGEVRVTFPPLPWAELVRAAFAPLRSVAADQPLVAHRILATLASLEGLAGTDTAVVAEEAAAMLRAARAAGVDEIDARALESAAAGRS